MTVGPAPPGHVLQLCWERLSEDEGEEAGDLLDVDPAPLDNPFPTTARVVCVMDPAVLAAADIKRLNVARSGKDRAWWHLRPPDGIHPATPPAHASGGARVAD